MRGIAGAVGIFIVIMMSVYVLFHYLVPAITPWLHAHPLIPH